LLCKEVKETLFTRQEPLQESWHDVWLSLEESAERPTDDTRGRKGRQARGSLLIFAIFAVKVPGVAAFSAFIGGFSGCAAARYSSAVQFF